MGARFGSPHQNTSNIGSYGRLLPVLECPLGVEPQERAPPCGKRRATTRHRGGLHGLEQLAFGRTMLNSPTHVGQHPLLAGAAEGQDTDDDHLPILDRQCLALPDREFGEGYPSLGVFWVLPRHPLPVGIAVGTGLLCQRFVGAAMLFAHEILRSCRANTMPCTTRIVAYVGPGRKALLRGDCVDTTTLPHPQRSATAPPEHGPP